MKHIFTNIVGVGFLGIYITAALPAAAHVKWFAEKGVEIPPATSLVAPIVWWIFVSALILAAAFIIDRSGQYRRSFFGGSISNHAIHTLAPYFTGIIGVYLVLSAVNGILFSQNILVPAGNFFLLLTEAVAGILLATGFLRGTGAALMLILWCIAYAVFPAVSILETIWVPFSALFVLSIYPFSYVGGTGVIRRGMLFLKHHMRNLLRWGIGINFIILGFSEKILRPELGLEFLLRHDWNFMRLLGLDFSNYAFVISAGFTEVLFGALLLFGWMTRAVALIAGVVFSIPLFILGPVELVGHLPYFAAIGMIYALGRQRDAEMLNTNT